MWIEWWGVVLEEGVLKIADTFILSMPDTKYLRSS